VAVIDGRDGNREGSSCYGGEEHISHLGAEPKSLNILPAISTNMYCEKWEYEICSDQSRTSSTCMPGKTEPAILFSLPSVITASVITAELASDGAGTGAPDADHHFLHEV
jgi:hypothetical protein